MKSSVKPGFSIGRMLKMKRITTQSFKQIGAILLATMLLSNFILPLTSHHWRFTLLSHDHIFIGPIQPGWETHHHHEDSGAHAHKNRIGQDRHQQQSQVISIYNLPLAEDFFTGSGLLSIWLPGLALLLATTWLIWPLNLASQLPENIFLPPLEKPPTAFL